MASNSKPSWEYRYKKVRSGVTTVGLSICLAGLLSSCDNSAEEMSHNHHHMIKAAEHVSRAVCTLYPTKGNDVYGVITFTETPEGVVIEGDVFNLTPGKHGFHVHEFGDVTADDGTATGGHYNPDGHDHSSPDSAMRHAGDLGNLDADRRGYARYKRVDQEIQLNGPESIIGRSIIVHVGEDDLVSQPTGNAGARVAQGVIGISK